MKKLIIFAIIAFLGFLGSQITKADMYGFERITSNSNTDVANQLFVDVTATSNINQVLFTFKNNVGIYSSITDIYFDDGPLLGIASITDSGVGVAFSQFAKPPDLPGGNGIFETTEGFSADSDPQSGEEDDDESGVKANGVDTKDEWVAILFNLQPRKTFNDVIAALANGSLRIGLHVQSIGTDGKSDSFVNDGPVVPVPGAILLGMLGMGVAGIKLRKYT